jgi:DNA invertase Pin-like site-specific DNA recombinase
MTKRSKERLSKYKEEAAGGKSFLPGDKVIGYFRDSGGEDQDRSVDEQRAEWFKGCEARGLLPYREFVDRAKSGTTAKGRKGLRDMVEYFESGQAAASGVRGLLLWSFARLARDETDSHFFITNLRRQGFLVQSMIDQIPDNSEFAVIAESMAIWRHAAYSRTLSKEVRRGQELVLANYRRDGGLYLLPDGEAVQLVAGGFPPLGYERHQIETGQNRRGTPRYNSYWKKTTDKDLARRVRLAWEMMLAGASYDEIEKACKFNKPRVAYNSMFTTITYTGVYSFGDFVRENAFEAYVTRDEYDRVQEIIDRRATGIVRRRPAAQKYLLSGMVVCGECGSPAHGERVHSRGRFTSYYYQCASRKSLKEVHSFLYKIRAELLETIVMQALLDEVLDETKLSGLVAERAAKAVDEKRDKELTSKISQLEDIVNKESETIKKLAVQLSTTAVELGIVPEIKELISEAKIRRERASNDMEVLNITDARRRLSNFKANLDLIRAARASVKNVLGLKVPSGEMRGNPTFETIHNLLKALRTRVILYPAGKPLEELAPDNAAVDPAVIEGLPRHKGILAIELDISILDRNKRELKDFQGILQFRKEVSRVNDNTPLQENLQKNTLDLKISRANDSAPGAVASFPMKLAYPIPSRAAPGPKPKRKN